MAKAQPILGLDVHEPILANSCVIIETRLGEMLNFEPYIDNATMLVALRG